MDASDPMHRALSIYFNAAADLADLMRLDLQKKGYFSDRTILALNKFVIAQNNIADLTAQYDEVSKTIN